VNQNNVFALDHGEVPHVVRCDYEVSYVHGLQLGLVKLAPIPTKKIPASTVKCSSVGCQWAGIIVPSVQRIWSTSRLRKLLQGELL